VNDFFHCTYLECNAFKYWPPRDTLYVIQSFILQV